MEVNFTGKIFFYCYPSMGPPEKEPYQHLLVCLGEGLRQLGIEFYSNINYWQESTEKEQYLFRHNPRVTPDDCSIVILQHIWFSHVRFFPENLFHPNRKYVTVYLDSQERNKAYSFNSEFRQFDFIFRTHYNSKFKYPSNFHPWFFGLSNRILQELEGLPNFQDKKRHLKINFRPTKAGHSVRNIICKEFVPRIQNILPIDDSIDSLNSPPLDAYHYLQWVQTGRRHYPSYYKRLKESAACACFGGFFVPPWPQDQSALITRVGKRVLSELGIKSNRIVQWDSWRFWESLASACAAFHVDFEKYGLTLPVMPENWRHYIGVDLDNIQEAVNRINDDPTILERIATEGRLWALEHYTPVPIALRFLETVCAS
jgi:hypothetical protein